MINCNTTFWLVKERVEYTTTDGRTCNDREWFKKKITVLEDE